MRVLFMFSSYKMNVISMILKQLSQNVRIDKENTLTLVRTRVFTQSSLKQYRLNDSDKFYSRMTLYIAYNLSKTSISFVEPRILVIRRISVIISRRRTVIDMMMS